MKRGRKPKNKTAIPQRTEFIELGTSRNRGQNVPSRNVSDTLIVSEATKQQIENDFDRREELVSTVLDLWYNTEDSEIRNNLVANKICLALNAMYLRPLEPDGYIFACIAYLSQLEPQLFSLDKIVSNTSSMLQKEPKIADDKSPTPSNFLNPFRRVPSIPLLCCAVLYNSHKNIEVWPLKFVQCYMEDAFNGRVWVDAEASRLFVLNILTFLPHPRSIVNGTQGAAARMSAGMSEGPNSSAFDELIRYRWSESLIDKINTFVIQMVQFHEAKRSENPIFFVRTLCTVAVIGTTRLLGSKYIDEWLTDLSLIRFAKEYLRRLCSETHEDSKEDIETVKNIIKMQVKPQQMQLYFDEVASLLSNNTTYPLVALTEFMHNEFKNAQPNFRLLKVICKALNDKPETHIAKIFHTLSIQEGNKTALQQFLRKINKTPSRDLQFDLTQFACDLCRLELDDMFIGTIIDRDAWLDQMVDLVCLTCLLCSPSTHEKEFLQRQQDFQMKVSTIQRYAIIWCHSIVPRIKASPILLRLMKKLLFMEPPNSYSFCITENSEVNLFGHVQNEMPVHEMTTTRISLIGVDPSFPVAPEAALEIISQLYYRAANLQVRDPSVAVMEVQNAALLQNILRLASVSAPSDPVNWVSNELYWKACLLLLILASFNPKTIGNAIWTSNYTIRQMMEMCVMQRFVNSPVEREIPTAMNNRTQKLQIYHSMLQKELNTLSKHTTQAARQLFEWLKNGYGMLEPPPDCPTELPRPILEKIERASSTWNLGKVLCSSRSPDFLVDIMQRQGAKLAISWLLPIIKEDPAALSNLPVSALVHLLFAYIDRDVANNSPEDFLMLLREFRKYFDDPNDCLPTQEILRLLFFDLSSPTARSTVKKASSLIFNQMCTLVSAIGSTKLDNNGAQVLKPVRRSTLYSPMRSPSNQRNSPADSSFNNLRMSGSLPSIIADQISELQRTISQKPSFEWLQNLKKLKYFHTSQEQIFAILRDVLLAEDVEDDFFSLLMFLTELVDSEPMHKYQLSCTLGIVLCGRRIIKERLFRSARVYQKSMLLLWDAFQVAKAAVNENIPPGNILVRVASSDPFLISEPIFRGLVNLICLSCRFPQTLELLPTSEKNFVEFNQHAASTLFDSYKSPCYKRDNKDDGSFLTLFSSENALDLICSCDRIMYETGAYFFTSEQLLSLIKTFGISLECMTVLIHRTLTELNENEIRAIFAAFPETIRQTIHQRVSMYISLDVTNAQKLLSTLKLPELEDSPKSNEFKLFQAPEDIEMEEDIPIIDNFEKFRNLEPSQMKTLMNEYFHAKTSIETQDNIRDALLVTSRCNGSREDQKQVSQILQTFQNQLTVFIASDDLMEKFFRLVLRKPIALIKMIDCIKICAVNLKETSKIDAIEEFCIQLRAKLLVRYPNRRNTPTISILFNYLNQQIQFQEDETNIEGEQLRNCLMIKENVESLLDASEIGSLEQFLSNVILTSPNELYKALLQVISKLPEKHNCLGVLLDSLHICSDVADSINKEHLYQSIFIRSIDTKSSLVLLSMILHHGSWENMKHCADWLFSIFPKLSHTNKDYTNALEFMRAFTSHPRSWNGYTTNDESSIIQQVPTLYKFSPNRLISLIDMIISEQSTYPLQGNPEDLLPNRLNFLRSALQQNTENLHSILLYVLDNKTDVLGEAEALQQIRGLLYLSFPRVVHSMSLLSDDELFEGSTKESQLDLTLHRLLRSLLDANLCEIAYRLLCNVVIQHKKIFLRYLPIMTALLAGRSHLEPQAFVEKQFYRLYMHCLGVLNLLRPEVFTCKDLKGLLSCFFALLENWCSDFHFVVVPLIEQFVNFLCYFSLDHSDELKEYVKVLENISVNYPDISKVRLLLDMIITEGKDQRISRCGLVDVPFSKEEIREKKRLLLLWSGGEFSGVGHFGAFNKDQVLQETANVLEELNRISSHNPSVLEPFVQCLLRIIASEFGQLRLGSYVLLLNYLNFCPASSAVIIPSFLKCLRSSPDIQSDALQNAHSFFFFAQDYSGLFLQELFNIGTAAAPVFKGILSTTTIF